MFFLLILYNYNKINYGYGISRFFTGELNVRYSPLDNFSTLGTKLIYCWKVCCILGSSGISLLGAAVIADIVLEEGGNEKIFTHLLGKSLSFIKKEK